MAESNSLPSSALNPATTQSALSEAVGRLTEAGIEEARLDARLLLEWVLRCRHEELVREPERILTPRQALIYAKAVALRAERRPVAYITGEQWFYNRLFKVNRAVLIPRPETEQLVEFALMFLPDAGRIADIGTGSGCIAVTLAAERPRVRVFAGDKSPLALRVARKNAVRHGVTGNVVLAEGDLLAPFTGQTFDVIVSNPPYVAPGDLIGLMPEVRDYEPILALTEGAGEDGTALHRRLLSAAPTFLDPGGWLAMEVGLGQAAMLVEQAREMGYKDVQSLCDFAGIPRIVAGRRPER